MPNMGTSDNGLTNEIDLDESSASLKFPTPRMFGRNKGSGIAVDLPVSATEFLMKVNFYLPGFDLGKLEFVFIS